MPTQGADGDSMNPVTRVLRAWMDADPSHTPYALALRAKLSSSTVYSLADPKRPRVQTPHPSTVDALAAALGTEWGDRFRQACDEMRAGTRLRRPKRGTPLQMLVIDRLIELKLSYDDVARRSGGTVSRPLLSHIVHGRTRRPTDATMEGLATALELPVQQLREALRESLDGTVYQLPPTAHTLSADGWAQVQAFIEYIAKTEADRGV